MVFVCSVLCTDLYTSLSWKPYLCSSSLSLFNYNIQEQSQWAGKGERDRKVAVHHPLCMCSKWVACESQHLTEIVYKWNTLLSYSCKKNCRRFWNLALFKCFLLIIGNKEKFPGLTDLKAQTDTPKERLSRKVLSKKAVRRVAKAMNSLNAKKYHDKFGYNFNYALRSWTVWTNEPVFCTLEMVLLLGCTASNFWITFSLHEMKLFFFLSSNHSMFPLWPP